MEFLFLSLIEFISFHSLFAYSFHSIVRIHYTHELYQRGARGIFVEPPDGCQVATIKRGFIFCL